jgi:integrase
MTTSTLTIRLIEAKQKLAPTRGLYLFDSAVKGFGARISPTCVTWIAQKSIGKQTQRIVIGHYPAMSLKLARIEAGHTISCLARGEDVASSRAAAKAAKIERLVCPTLKEAIADYLAQRKGRRRRSDSTQYEDHVRRALSKVEAELSSSTRVNQVSKADIRSLLKTRIDARNFEAARWLFSQLRPFFDWCVHEEHITVSPCVGVIPPAAGKERQHKLTEAEIKAYWLSSTANTNCLGPYFRVLLLTAQRRTEVASMQWQEVNLDKAEWIIPASKTKNGREHLVPLSTTVVAILRSLPSRASSPLAEVARRKPSEYVFGKYADAPVSGFSKAKRQLDAAMVSNLQAADQSARVSDWRLHDVRRTGASGMAALGVHPHIVEAVLNHTPGKLQRTYQVYLYAKEKREALQWWSSHVSRLVVENTSKSNVISLPL